MTTVPSNDKSRGSTSDAIEVSLLDILCFFKNAYKTMLLFGVIGIAAAIFYIVSIPKQYESIAIIAMAQVGLPGTRLQENSGAVNVEEPSLLISRLSLPTSFPPQVLISCGLEGSNISEISFANTIKLSQPKSIDNVVELKTFGLSPKLSESCANEIFNLVKTSQNKIAQTSLEQLNNRLLKVEDRLKRLQDNITKSEKLGEVVGPIYFSTRDELNYLIGEKAAFENAIIITKARGAHLIAPIYANEVPVRPKKRLALMAGLLGGVLFGLMIALFRLPMVKEICRK